MHIRKANVSDADRIMQVFAVAKKFMVENGNPTQWRNGYPQLDMLNFDILHGNCFVCEERGEIVGTFSLIFGEEPTYRIIENGNWSRTSNYGTIHRLASNGKAKGIAKACFDYCCKCFDYIRIDTHADNYPMQRAIRKYGFHECGIIYVEDGSKRIAFDYSTVI